MLSTWFTPRLSATLATFSFAAAALAALLVCAGCATHPRSSGSDLAASDPVEAERLAVEAGRLLESDPSAAESLLRKAIALDPHCGIAYNNLGTLQLDGRVSATGPDLYGAAESFQTAARLLPGRADPRVNLGLVTERAGRFDDALAAYASAVESAPSHIGAVQALTSLEIRYGKSTAQTTDRLKTIAVQGTDSTWRSWARDQLLRTGRQ
jgi:Tfp pilus assembly protein PilF